MLSPHIVKREVNKAKGICYKFKSLFESKKKEEITNTIPMKQDLDANN